MSATGLGWAAAAVAAAAGLLVSPGPAARVRLGAVRPPRTRLPVPPLPALVMALGALLGGALAGPAGAVVGGLAAHTARRRRAASRRRADAAAATTELAESLTRIVEELGSGAHPAAALAGVATDGPLAARALGPAAAAAALGDDVAAALERSAEAAGPTAGELRRVAAAWSLAQRHGAPLAALLDGTLADLRWRHAFETRVHARMAGPRSTAAVLTALPVLGLGLGHLLGADPLGVLRGGVLGQVLLLVGAGLLAAGLSWSDRIGVARVPT